MVFTRLLFLFVAVPLIELSLLIKLGKILGALNTILIVVLTGILGAAFARSQGAGIVSRIKNALSQGRIPGDELIQGLLIMAGGLMLITPGFITDLLGFALILPPTRKLAAGWLLAYFKTRIQAGQWQVNNIHFADTDDFRGDESVDPPEIKE
jgi:UPF0716 protein FxsA